MKNSYSLPQYRADHPHPGRRSQAHEGRSRLCTRQEREKEIFPGLLRLEKRTTSLELISTMEISGLPSPFMSPTRTSFGQSPPVGKSISGAKEIAPGMLVFLKIATASEELTDKARSGLPSPSRITDRNSRGISTQRNVHTRSKSNLAIDRDIPENRQGSNKIIDNGNIRLPIPVKVADDDTFRSCIGWTRHIVHMCGKRDRTGRTGILKDGNVSIANHDIGPPIPVQIANSDTQRTRPNRKIDRRVKGYLSAGTRIAGNRNSARAA